IDLSAPVVDALVHLGEVAHRAYDDLNPVLLAERRVRPPLLVVADPDVGGQGADARLRTLGLVGVEAGADLDQPALEGLDVARVLARDAGHHAGLAGLEHEGRVAHPVHRGADRRQIEPIADAVVEGHAFSSPSRACRRPYSAASGWGL